MNITALLLCAAISSASANEVSSSLPQSRLDVVCKYASVVIEASEEHNVSPYLLAALIFYESSWHTKAKSHAGACGLTQVIPKYSKYSCKQLLVPRISIKEGAAKLRGWIDFTVRKHKHEDVAKALACYNAGYTCLGSTRARQYSRKVSALAVIYKRDAYYAWCQENPDDPEDHDCEC
mgnify:CR=1 FL=1